jgi:hypothetical protein
MVGAAARYRGAGLELQSKKPPPVDLKNGRLQSLRPEASS